MSFNQLHHLDQLPDALGPQLVAGSLSVVYPVGYSLPISLVNDTNYGTVGNNTLRTAAQIGNVNGPVDFGSGVSSAQTLRVMLSSDSSVIVSSSALPAGAATESTLGALNTKIVITANGIKTDGSATTQPISGSVTVSASALPAGAATEATLSALNAKNITTAAGIKVDASGATLPISAAALPLPAGASTEATLSTLNTKMPANLTVTATRLLVDGSGVTQPISGAVSVSNFPSGGATEITLAALNAKHNNDYGASSGALRIASQLGNSAGQADFNAGAATAQTLRVALATGATITTTPTTVPYITSTDTLHGTTPVTTVAWVQLVASTSAIINRLTCFSSSGSVLELGIGAAGSESRTLLLPPGGFDATISLTIPASTRISVRAVDVNAVSGELQFNFCG